MSKFGYQPKPNPPPDFEEFLDYQRQLNSMIRYTLHQDKRSNASYDAKRFHLEEENKISTDNNKDGKLRNRDRSVKSDVHKQRRRKTTGKRKSNK